MFSSLEGTVYNSVVVGYTWVTRRDVLTKSVMIKSLMTQFSPLICSNEVATVIIATCAISLCVCVSNVHRLTRIVERIDNITKCIDTG